LESIWRKETRKKRKKNLKENNMKKLTTLGRILFALPFLVFGINHFLMMDYYVGMLTSFIPLGAYTIIITGLLMIVTSISIITKKYIIQSTIILASLLFLFIVTIHIPHLFDGTDRAITLIALLKDISLMGGSLMIAGLSVENKV
jgi:putative oxidoreductase